MGVEDVRPMPVLPETATLDAVLETLRREHTQMAAVLDEHGGTAGLVTVSDLFDEIVGEIGEGALAEPPSIRRDDRGVLHVAGTVRVEEVGEELGFPLEHPEVDSVSGLVLARLGRLPSVGDEVVYQGVRFTVEAMQGNGVRTAAVVREGASDAG